MSTSFSLEQLARMTGCQYRGCGTRIIEGLSEIDESSPNRLSFVADAPALSKLPPHIPIAAEERIFPADRDGLVLPAFRAGMAKILAVFEPRYQRSSGIAPTSFIDPSSSVEADAVIGPNCTICERAVIGHRVLLAANVYIGPEVQIGDDTVIEPGAVLQRRTQVGRRCLIHSCAVLGADGFGIIPGGPEGQNIKIPQIGRVILGDDVEIGACTCVDRGTIGDTIIGNGTKTDNQVQIGHNCHIGRSCIIASQSGVSGSVVIEDGAIMAARSGIQDHRRVGRGAIVAALAGVTKDVVPETTVSGFPAMDHKEHFRIEALMRRLPDLFSRLKLLEKQIQRQETDQ